MPNAKNILKRVSLALVATALLAAAPAAAAPNQCISTRDITHQTVEKGGKSILFAMRDGAQWRNTLQGACPDLVYNGYVWVVRNPGERVCENEQTLQVLESGQVCVLGPFEKLPASIAPAARP